MAATVLHYDSTNFPGEAYLNPNISLPNYQWERRAIIVKLVVATFLFFVWLPKKFVFHTVLVDKGDTPANGDKTAAADAVTNCRNKKRRRKNDKSNNRSNCNHNDATQPQEQVLEMDSFKSSILTILGIITLFLILFTSPNNLFPSRSLLRTPLFTAEECNRLVVLAERAAKKNEEDATKEKKKLLKEFPELVFIERQVKDGKMNETQEVMEKEGWRELRRLNSILESPSGWKKDRHTLYPTTDLNLVTDPFTPDDRKWLASILDARLSPLMERAFGVFRGAIRANDIFVVRYDGVEGKGQNRLRMHTDSSHLSFNVLLNDGFEGGGTRFHHRIEQTTIDIHPEVGETLLSHAMVLHEGLPTTSGTRYILVGFNSIDAKDPLTHQSTNLSIFSSWLNFSWMQVRFREGAGQGIANRRKSRRAGNESDAGILSNKYITSLFSDLDTALTWLGDKFAPLRAGKLVSNENATDYISTMDKAATERREHETAQGLERTRANGYASWFQGQNIHLDVFGGYADSWKERNADEAKFKSENL